MSSCGIQSLPSCNAVAPPPEFLTTIPKTSTTNQVTNYNILQAWVNTLLNSTWYSYYQDLSASSTYTTGKAECDAFYATAPSTLTNARVLVMSPEGRVFYDSAKGTSNTYANSPTGFSGYVATTSAGSPTTKLNNGDGNINGNHGMRPDVIAALNFNPTGYGYATYYSTTALYESTYVSKRIGDPLGASSFAWPGCVIRVSAQVS